MKRPDYCPEWFDISQYDESYKWQRREWAIAFEHKIYHYNENLEYAHNPCLGYEINNDCIKSWKSLFLGNTDVPSRYRDLQLSKNLISDDMYKLSFEDLEQEQRKSSPVGLSLFGMLGRLGGPYRYGPAIVDSDGEELQIDYISNVGIELPELGKFRYEKKAGEYKHSTPVLINFQDYNDEELKEMFASFLKRYRAFQLYGGFGIPSKKHDETRRFSDSEIESLNKFRVLPCLDLLIWEVYTGQHFTHEELLFLLFGDGTEAIINPKTGTEWFPDKFTIKDSVLPKANLLLDMISNPFENRYEIQSDSDIFQDF